ncbi:Hypothetical protein PBC10988_33740 [Planctomycetales bacterium 10988]|nr:Hypothetical protein PBC10988_33740 [Planctomycetales bacterium 10988]
MVKNRVSFGQFQIGGNPEESGEATSIPSGEPLRILVIGDFSGRGSRISPAAAEALKGRKIRFIDRDNFEEMLETLKVTLHLPAFGKSGEPLELSFSEMEDFHPDQLYENVDRFEELSEIREDLESPRRFDKAAAKVLSWTKPATPKEEKESAALTTESANDPEEFTIDDLLDATEEAQASPSGGGDASVAQSQFDQIMQNIVSPHAVPSEDPKLPELLEMVDDAISGTMRALLHDPAFCKLEAAWKGLEFLVHRLETGTDLKIYLLDLSEEELKTGYVAQENLEETAAYKHWVEKAMGESENSPWSLIVLDHAFGTSVEDAELLGRLSQVAAAGKATLFAAGTKEHAGIPKMTPLPDPTTWEKPLSDEETEAWQALRELPQVQWTGLTFPRFLLRFPYGGSGLEVEAFDFVEFPEVPEHDALLWGNGAYVAATILGSVFSQVGWGFDLQTPYEIGNLPLLVYEEDGDSQLKPNAEVLLTDRALAYVQEAGLIPLQTVAHSDRLRIGTWQSIAGNGSPLAGRWQG